MTEIEEDGALVVLSWLKSPQVFENGRKSFESCIPTILSPTSTGRKRRSQKLHDVQFGISMRGRQSRRLKAQIAPKKSAILPDQLRATPAPADRRFKSL